MYNLNYQEIVEEVYKFSEKNLFEDGRKDALTYQSINYLNIAKTNIKDEFKAKINKLLTICSTKIKNYEKIISEKAEGGTIDTVGLSSEKQRQLIDTQTTLKTFLEEIEQGDGIIKTLLDSYMKGFNLGMLEYLDNL